MKNNIKLYFFVVLVALFLIGCSRDTNSQDGQTGQTEEVDLTEDTEESVKENLTDIKGDLVISNMDNSISKAIQIKYDGVFNSGEENESQIDITLNITELKVWEDGTLYRLELEQPSLQDAREKIQIAEKFLGYFYVTDDQIYVKPFAEIEEYVDIEDEEIIRSIDLDKQAFLEGCYLVCSEEEMEEVEDSYLLEKYDYIDAVGERRFFHYRNIPEDVENREYWNLTWEKGNGIVYYYYGSKDAELSLFKEVEEDNWIDTENIGNAWFFDKVQETAEYKEKEDEGVENPWFFDEGQQQIAYDGVIYPLNSYELKQDITLNVFKIAELENGILYGMELDQPSVDDPWDEISWGRRYLGYYYVTNDTIYLSFMPSRLSADDDGYTDERNQEIIRILEDDEEEFINNYCHIVCSTKATDRTPNENGYYGYVVPIGDRCIFRFGNTYTGGTRTYCTIVWEKGKGMTYYLYGEGSRLMEVALYYHDEF